jgi:hypothetical protein
MGALITFFSSPIGRLIGVGAIAAILAGGATFWLTSQGYKATIAQMKANEAKADADRANAVLAKYEADTAIIHDAANAFAATQGTLVSKLDTISKDLKNVQAKHPLPANCKPDADRLRNLEAAVAAANAAAGLGAGPAVPTANRPH